MLQQKNEKNIRTEHTAEELHLIRQDAIEKLRETMDCILKHSDPAEYTPDKIEQTVWQTLKLFQNYPFFTAKNLEFTYILKGNEMFVNRKEKSITKATIIVAFRKALELQLNGISISGPKKLGTFGASYLYPIFIQIGIICNSSVSV